MLTRAKFLRLSGATAATALAVTPEAYARAKTNDGVVRVKSIYGFRETIERLKKDIATKGIKFFDEIYQSKLAADAGIKLNPSTLLVSAIRCSARSSSRQTRTRGSTGRCGFW